MRQEGVKEMQKTKIDLFVTKNGLPVSVRPLQPDDAPHLVDLFEHMSAESRYRRFYQPLNNIARDRIWAEAENIAHTEPLIGFIAFADLPDQPAAPIGAARCVCLADGEAEAAVSVRDDMQNQGVGTHLLSLLAEEARARGVYHLTATIQNANKAIIHVLNRLPYPYTRTAVGPESELILDLTAL